MELPPQPGESFCADPFSFLSPTVVHPRDIVSILCERGEINNDEGRLVKDLILRQHPTVKSALENFDMDSDLSLLAETLSRIVKVSIEGNSVPVKRPRGRPKGTALSGKKRKEKAVGNNRQKREKVNEVKMEDAQSTIPQSNTNIEKSIAPLEQQTPKSPSPTEFLPQQQQFHQQISIQSPNQLRTSTSPRRVPLTRIETSPTFIETSRSPPKTPLSLKKIVEQKMVFLTENLSSEGKKRTRC